MSPNQHKHQYRRVLIGSKWAMRCVKSNCSHYIWGNGKLSFPLLIDRIAECSRCHEFFQLTRRATRMNSPCCEDCIKSRNKKKLESAAEFFKSLEESIQ